MYTTGMSFYANTKWAGREKEKKEMEEQKRLEKMKRINEWARHYFAVGKEAGMYMDDVRWESIRPEERVRILQLAKEAYHEEKTINESAQGWTRPDEKTVEKSKSTL